MQRAMKVVSVLALAVWPLSVPLAQAQAPEFTLPDFLKGCDAPAPSQDCIARAWKYGEVVADGFLTTAEIGRLMRGLGLGTDAKKLGNVKFTNDAFSKQYDNVQNFISMNISSQSSQQVISDYDYDGDGKLSLSEFSGEPDAAQAPALAQLVAIARTMHDFSGAIKSAMDDADKPEPGAGLIQEDVAVKRDVVNGTHRLVVSGFVKNTMNGKRNVPDLMASLLDGDKNILVTKRYQGIEPLAAGETAPFEMIFENPPALTRTMKLEFGEE